LLRLFTLLLYDYSLTFDLENLFSSDQMNICAKFHSNPFTKYGDIASSEIAVNGQRMDGRTDGRTDKPKT